MAIRLTRSRDGRCIEVEADGAVDAERDHPHLTRDALAPRRIRVHSVWRNIGGHIYP